MLPKLNCKVQKILFKLNIMGSFAWYIRKTFGKTNVSNPLIRTHACTYQGLRNVIFSKNFANFLNE